MVTVDALTSASSLPVYSHSAHALAHLGAEGDREWRSLMEFSDRKE
jgi:hypothetical protein